jgi:hypothetical protein
MTVTRDEVLRRLAAASDAEHEETTTVEALAAACGTDESAVRSRLETLVDCDLARVAADGRTRVTITGEELLALDAGEPVIVDTGGGGFIGRRTQSGDEMEADRR